MNETPNNVPDPVREQADVQQAPLSTGGTASPPAEGLIREQADAIVASGQNVRQRISQLVAETAHRFHLDREGLLGLTRSVLEGAMAAVDRAVPHDPDSVLRQVVDGLGDGLSAAALSSRLAFEEAKEQGRTFASEDLKQLFDDMQTVRTLFVDTVAKTAGKVRSLAAGELASLRAHAEKARARIQPSLESALSAAAEHPLRLASESAEAGIAVSRLVLGALFTAVGRRLQEAGQRIKGADRPG